MRLSPSAAVRLGSMVLPLVSAAAMGCGSEVRRAGDTCIDPSAGATMTVGSTALEVTDVCLGTVGVVEQSPDYLHLVDVRMSEGLRLELAFGNDTVAPASLDAGALQADVTSAFDGAELVDDRSPGGGRRTLCDPPAGSGTISLDLLDEGDNGLLRAASGSVALSFTGCVIDELGEQGTIAVMGSF